MLTMPNPGLEYHRIHTEQLTRTVRPTLRTWGIRNKGNR